MLRAVLVAMGLATCVMLGYAIATGDAWPGVTLAFLTLWLALAIAAQEAYLAGRRSVILEAWEDRLAALEAREEKTRAEVDTLTRERALNRM